MLMMMIMMMIIMITMTIMIINFKVKCNLEKTTKPRRGVDV